MPRPDDILLSLVVPVYNEREALPHLLRELDRVLATLSVRADLVFVDDASSDGTPDWLASLATRDARVQVLRLARNSGHQVALFCGLDHARGGVVITLDADLQHPPEHIPAMLARWRDGADVVHMVKARTERRGLVKDALATFFYAVFNALSDVQLPANGSDFRLLDRACVDALKAMPERGAFLRGMVQWVGFAQSSIPYVAPPRVAGTASYTIRKLWDLAAAGFLAFSSRALVLPAVIGGAFVVASAVLMAAAIAGVAWLARDTWVLLSAMTFFTGMLGLCAGLMGAFLYRVLLETKRRPLYTLARALGNVDPRAVKTWGVGSPAAQLGRASQTKPAAIDDRGEVR